MAYILLFMIVGLAASGQSIVPGYQGKRTIIDYKLSVCPSLRYPTYLNAVASREIAKTLRLEYNHSYPEHVARKSVFIPFNCMHTLSLERVVGRKFALSFNYMLAASKEYFSFYQLAPSPNGTTMRSYSYDQQLNIFGHYYTGSFVFYGRRSLAPFGRYIKLTAGYCRIVSKMVGTPKSWSYTDVYDNTPTLLDNKQAVYKLGSMGLGISFGTNRIYKDKIVVNHGLSLFLPVKRQRSVHGEISTVMLTRMKLRDIASLYLGCGYLF